MLADVLSWLAFIVIGFFCIYPFFCLGPHRKLCRWLGRTWRYWTLRRLPPVDLGLDEVSFVSLPMESFADLKLFYSGRVPSDCGVCLDPFEDDETLRFIMKCRHAFHVSCLDPWLVNHTTCPTCRASLVYVLPEPTRSNDVVLEVVVESVETEVTEPESEILTEATPPNVLWAQLWTRKSPLRLKVLVGRVLAGAMPLSDTRPCLICGGEWETPEHLFFTCPVARALWYVFWGIRTDVEVTGEWTAANWVEASLFLNRLLAVELEEEGEMFLFLACLIDKILLDYVTLRVKGPFVVLPTAPGSSSVPLAVGATGVCRLEEEKNCVTGGPSMGVVPSRPGPEAVRGELQATAQGLKIIGASN